MSKFQTQILFIDASYGLWKFILLVITKRFFFFVFIFSLLEISCKRDEKKLFQFVLFPLIKVSPKQHLYSLLFSLSRCNNIILLLSKLKDVYFSFVTLNYFSPCLVSWLISRRVKDLN